MIIIETNRLFLRTWNQADISGYQLINQDPKVVRFLLKTPPHDYIKHFTDSMNRQFQAVNYTLFAVEEKISGKLMGFMGLNFPQWYIDFTSRPCVEIGWRLAFPFWGHGYATEGGLAILDYGFNQCALIEIVAFTVPENLPSIRVMEKIGMVRDSYADFNHPLLSKKHPRLQHILYRIGRA